jgi:glutamine synthetase
MHANFSNEVLRTCGSKKLTKKFVKLSVRLPLNIAVYGAYNDLRLTGKHETASIHDFSYGISDRGCSIRIPLMTVQKDGKDGLKTEDRFKTVIRKIAARITVNSVL